VGQSQQGIWSRGERHDCSSHRILHVHDGCIDDDEEDNPACLGSTFREVTAAATAVRAKGEEQKKWRRGMPARSRGWTQQEKVRGSRQHHGGTGAGQGEVGRPDKAAREGSEGNTEEDRRE
jgi:hypothetical protein